jgi:hypothetical protein
MELLQVFGNKCPEIFEVSYISKAYWALGNYNHWLLYVATLLGYKVTHQQQ